MSAPYKIVPAVGAAPGDALPVSPCVDCPAAVRCLWLWPPRNVACATREAIEADMRKRRLT